MMLIAGGWGITPSEFWAMTLPEYVSLMEFHTEQRRKASGQLSPEDRAELMDWVMNEPTAS